MWGDKIITFLSLKTHLSLLEPPLLSAFRLRSRSATEIEMGTGTDQFLGLAGQDSCKLLLVPLHPLLCEMNQFHQVMVSSERISTNSIRGMAVWRWPFINGYFSYASMSSDPNVLPASVWSVVSTIWPSRDLWSIFSRTSSASTGSRVRISFNVSD